jgi:hypothetical protein
MTTHNTLITVMLGVKERATAMGWIKCLKNMHYV